MSFYDPYRWCVALNCKNSTLKTREKLFIKVPNDDTMRYVWLELAGKNPTKYSIKSHLYLCEDHFNLEQDMENYIQYKIMGSIKKIRMKPNTVPSMFDHLPVVKPTLDAESTTSLQPSPSKYNEESCCPESEIQVLAESQTGQDPLANVEPKQCRYCFKITENTANGKPYIKDNKTTLTLNGINIEIDFSNDTQTVCVECDKILLDTFNFVQQVKNAQSLLTQTLLEEPVETLIVKTECESPIPDDDDIYEDAREIDDSTTEETVVNVFTHKKRKPEDTRRPTTKHKKKYVVDNDNETCDDCESNGNVLDIKLEDTEMDDHLEITETNIHKYEYTEDRDTGPDVEPSEVDNACSAFLNAIREKR